MVSFEPLTEELKNVDEDRNEVESLHVKIDKAFGILDRAPIRTEKHSTKGSVVN